jgi:hypothetical protein
LDSAATYIQHMQKALTQMNVQLHYVVSDITGVTGMRIVRAIVAGERDAATLAAFRDSRCKEPVETIREALIGNYREEHVFALTQALELYDIHQKKVAECDKRIETVLEQLKATGPTPAKPLPALRYKTKQSPRCRSARQSNPAEVPLIDAEILFKDSGPPLPRWTPLMSRKTISPGPLLCTGSYSGRACSVP